MRCRKSSCVSVDLVCHLPCSIPTYRYAGARGRIRYGNAKLCRHLNVKDRPDARGCWTGEQHRAGRGTCVIKDCESDGAANSDHDPAYTSWCGLQRDSASAGGDSLAEPSAVCSESLADKSGYHEFSCRLSVVSPCKLGPVLTPRPKGFSVGGAVHIPDFALRIFARRPGHDIE